MIRTEHREGHWNFPFVEYAPATAQGQLPLIIHLHGAGERGDAEDLSIPECFGFSKIMDVDRPCRLVIPRCPADTFWAARVESIIAFIQQLKDAYEVDEDRVYLTGLSMGGYGTWYTAMARPDLFAAIAPVCGGGMAWNASVLTMPVWAFHGVDDPVVSVTQSDEMVEALRRAGRDVTYTRLDGVQHNAWDYAYNEELLTWLLQHTRK